MDGRHERCFICNDPTHRAGEDSIYIGVSGIGPWCDSCYQDMVQEVEGDARAEERALAANAPADPALLALARFGADVIASHRSPMGRWAQPSLLALPDIARDTGVTIGGQFAPGIASAIARLVATDGAGEVAP